jgi:hypothetical protein
MWSSLDVDLSGVRVTVDPGATTATVDATATLHGARAGAEEKTDARRVAFRFVKDGSWKTSAITVYPPSD